MLYFKDKFHSITIRLSDFEYFFLKSYSVDHQVSISSLIRRIIRFYRSYYEHK